MLIKVDFFIFSHGTISSKYHPELGLEIILDWMHWVFCSNAASFNFFDPEHSENENRFILLGTSFKSKTLVVCHCFREEETRVRIISARKADKDEQKAYWSERQ